MKLKLKSIISWVAVSISGALLLGCSTFGVPNAQWKGLSPAQKKVAMKSYYQEQQVREEKQAEIDKINAQNAPLNNAITGLLHALPKKTRGWGHGHSHTATSCSNGSCDSNTQSSHSGVSVTTPF